MALPEAHCESNQCPGQRHFRIDGTEARRGDYCRRVRLGGERPWWEDEIAGLGRRSPRTLDGYILRAHGKDHRPVPIA